MKNKKGFTLVELLAVIAILAILVIMALPAVLRMFNQARVDSFTNELNTIIRTTRQQYLLSGGEAKTYTNASSSSNTLPLTGNSDLKYLVKIDGEGKVTRLQVTNGDYCYNRSGNIDTAESKDVKTNCTLDVDNTYTSLTQAVFITGREFNVRIKQLAGDDTSERSNATINTNITAITRASSEPSASNKTSEHIVSTSESQYPIYVWYDNGTLYWWSEIEHPTLNENADNMFRALHGLTSISGLSAFDTSNVLIMRGIFLDDIGLTSLSGIEGWNTSNVTDLSFAFAVNSSTYGNGYRSSLNDISALLNWDVSNVSIMAYTFQDCTSLTSLNGLQNWNVSSVTTMHSMFYRNTVLTNITALHNWNVLNVTDMVSTFQNNASLSSLSSLENWNVSNVTSMEALFYKNTSLTTLSGLENWNVSKVTNMENMFVGATGITTLSPLTNWDVSSVTTMGSMFKGATGIVSLNGLQNWNVSNVMNFSEGNDNNNSHTEGMFQGMTSLTDASAINDWNINRNAYFNYMFKSTPVHPTFSKVNGTWDSNNGFVPSN